MKKPSKKTKKIHKGSHRVAANHHRHVHISVVWLFAILLFAISLSSSVAISAYVSARHRIHLHQGGIDIGIYSIKYDDVGTYPFTPPKGQKFVIVKVSVVNTNSAVFNFAPVLQTYLSDDSGHKYYMSPATLKDPIKAGPIETNGKRIGTLSYLVPLNAKNLTLQFQL